ncbi:hypothetical protein [Acrocarpospora catenulata]|uniref:hypothetical protein n=1 Tax=Acrocarpospora catenulata TaxID=2836182 RepID=UPI001BDAF1B3|nr:hypothetical protein [Acrocarpospora catenulata]
MNDQLTELCANAVDPLEIAAGLEFDGLNDEGAASHGHPDVFAYAEALYRTVPRRPVEPAEPLPDPWAGDPVRHAVRGVLFGLPGLCYVTAAQAVTGSTLVLLVSLLLAWAYGQGAAYLAYVAIGHGNRDEGLAVARRGLRIGLAVLVPVVAATGWATGASLAAVLLATGQVVYLLAAGAILVAGGELVLLAALVPGCVLSVVYLAVGWPHVWAVWAAGALTVLEALVLAEWVSRTKARPGRLPLSGAVAPALFGALCGGLLAAGAPLEDGALVMVPLSLSMGAAEWAVYRFRRGGHLLLRRTETARRFARGVRVALVAALGRYLGVLALLTALVVWVSGTLAPVGNLALGGAVLVALVLQSFGINRPVLVLFAAALAVRVHLPRLQLGVDLGLLVGVVAVAWSSVARPSLHQ